MQQLFDRLAAISLLAKIGALIGVVVLLVAGYWYFFYSDMQDEIGQLQSQGAKLQQERKEYEKR
ncbi:MAG: hypothetical protein ACXWLR_01600, partial [Myxococcales bacterium]